MGFRVTLKPDADDSTTDRYGNADTYELRDYGVLLTRRSDGSTTIYSPTGWASISVDPDHGPRHA